MKKRIIFSVLLLLVALSCFAADDQIFSIIKKGSIKELRQYLKMNPGAINVLDGEEMSPLMLAVRLKKNKMAKLLAKRGADPVAKKGAPGNFALYEAIRVDNEEIVKWFFLNGLDFNYVNSGTYRHGEDYSNPVFHSIARSSSQELVKFMIDRGVDLGMKNARGGTCLNFLSHLYIRDYHNKKWDLIERVTLLLDAGADINSHYGEGLSYLMKVISTPGNYLTSSESSRLSEIVKLLISRGIELNYQDSEGWTALHCAVWFNHKDVLKILLDAGADPTREHKDGEKPIDFAKRTRRMEMVKLLKDAERKRR